MYRFLPFCHINNMVILVKIWKSMMRLRDFFPSVLTVLIDFPKYFAEEAQISEISEDEHPKFIPLNQIFWLLCIYNWQNILSDHSYLPIVKSWTGWKRLSVNWRSKHDFPTPEKEKVIMIMSQVKPMKIRSWKEK